MDYPGLDPGQSLGGGEHSCNPGLLRLGPPTIGNKREKSLQMPSTGQISLSSRLNFALLFPSVTDLQEKVMRKFSYGGEDSGVFSRSTVRCPSNISVDQRNGTVVVTDRESRQIAIMRIWRCAVCTTLALMTLSLLGGLFAYSRLSGVGRRLSPLAARDATIPDRDTTLLDRDTAIPDRDTVLLDRNATIPDKDTTLPNRDTTLLDRDTAIPDRDTTHPDRNATLLDRDTAIPDRDTTHADRDTAIPDRDTTHPDRDATHPDRNAMIPDRDTTKDATRNNTQRAPVTTPPLPHFDPFVREILDDPVFHNSSALGKNNATHRPPGELLRILGKIDSRPWSFNKLAVEQIRRELEESTNTRELLVLTQQNTQPNTSIGFAHSNLTFYIPESLHKYQPQVQLPSCVDEVHERLWHQNPSVHL
ncbi:hypothetical protein Bbelb_119200 [Branchiostoma belcheri]|nr:hypothetical protein Bbelb_119200 [Branchiostoma belcheri]